MELPLDLDQPIRQILIFGSWIVGCATSRIEVWKSGTLEHYTTLFPAASRKGDNELTGGICTMPTYLNKIFAGRKDGWVEIWNVSTGKLIYTILPPSTKFGGVAYLEPTPALSLLAISYTGGPLVIRDVLRDKAVVALDAGTEDAPVTAISFRTDGQGAGEDGRSDGVMATATARSGDVTFWDLNNGGRIMGVLRSAHNPPSHEGDVVRGGIGKIEFLPGQPVILTSGLDNSLKSWIFDETPFSPVPRILHSRSGHAAPVRCLQFLPSDFDGAEAGNKWLLSGGQDRSLWGWSLRRDGQSTELSQGNIRKKAKKAGVLSTSALSHGPTTSLDELKAPEITCIASSLNRDGGIGAMPGKQAMWQKTNQRNTTDAEVSGTTGWESVVTAHKDDSYARTWFWGRKRAGRWAFQTSDGATVSTVAVSPCGSFALVGSAGGAIDMFNLQSGLHRQRFPSKLTPAQARQLKMLQLKQADDVVQLHSRSSKAFGPGTGRHSKAVTGIVVDSMNKTVISCSLDGKINFWDFLTGNLVDQVDWAPMTGVTGCRYHGANDLIAFSCDDNSIRVVDVETKNTIREFWGCQGGINDFCFSSDGRWIVAASQDSVLRVWDLPTSHLIDAVRLEKPFQALGFSSSGEYLAAATEGELGVQIWTNKTLFRHVPTRQIAQNELSTISGPTASGEGGEGLLEAAFEEEVESEQDDTAAPSVDQLSQDIMTLSLVPKSRWQTLLHLDLIKQRNKPKEPPKAPEKAPFFLGSLHSTSGAPDRAVVPATGKGDKDGDVSRIFRTEYTREQQAFTAKLLAGAASGDCACSLPPPARASFVLTTLLPDDAFIDHLKSLPPSAADLELRSLKAPEDDDDAADEPGRRQQQQQPNELLLFVRALTSRLLARRDYELAQAWMTVFLRLHHDAVAADAAVAGALREWRAHQERERARLDALVGYCGGVVGFLRSPRS